MESIQDPILKKSYELLYRGIKFLPICIFPLIVDSYISMAIPVKYNLFFEGLFLISYILSEIIILNSVIKMYLAISMPKWLTKKIYAAYQPMWIESSNIDHVINKLDQFLFSSDDSKISL